jgi:hypothetical protein
MKSSEINRQERLESDLKMGPAWVKIEGWAMASWRPGQMSGYLCDFQWHKQKKWWIWKLMDELSCNLEMLEIWVIRNGKPTVTLVWEFSYHSDCGEKIWLCLRIVNPKRPSKKYLSMGKWFLYPWFFFFALKLFLNSFVTTNPSDFRHCLTLRVADIGELPIARDAAPAWDEAAASATSAAKIAPRKGHCWWEAFRPSKYIMNSVYIKNRMYIMMIFFDILWYIVLYYVIFWYIIIYYDILWYILIYYDILWYVILWYIINIWWYIMLYIMYWWTVEHAAMMSNMLPFLYVPIIPVHP